MVEIGVIKMMNGINYTANKNGAKFYLIRQCTNDTDLALALPTMLALALKNAGCEIDFELVFLGGGGDYDLEEPFIWIKRAEQR